ncbi:Isochorismatase hydrolase [Ascodesmis nigricans]|uniref:Isochorismatase hydrolase n=1 Tax=Ascodesmis nigricans TaxID=341454 RepID=A0A4S2MIR3_9PEZI|nr:Isochorismatase hydrolase [Ascodesmis nigricans]
MASRLASRPLQNPALFICDLQTAFVNAIHQFPAVISTTQKLLTAAQILSIPVIATTQSRGKLGSTVPELKIDEHPNLVGHWDKTKFSMVIPEVREKLKPRSSVAIVGIESHICVTHTVLDLLREGHEVYVIADGVSSCHPQEVPIALARLREAGATITSSESWIYEVMGDANIPQFKQIAKLVKEQVPATKKSLQCLL